jgi:hypothetical protein
MSKKQLSDVIESLVMCNKKTKESIAVTVNMRNIISQHIWNQDGSNVKGIQELVQNAVDAGCSKLNITVTNDKIVVEDNGRGIPHDVVKVALSVLGTSTKSGQDLGIEIFDDYGKSIGHFGIGFYQAVAMGLLTLRANTRLYTINAKQSRDNDEDYHFIIEKEGLKDFKGSRVEIKLYDERKMSDSDVEDLVSDLKGRFLFPKTEMTVNSEIIEPVVLDDKVIHMPFTTKVNDKELTTTIYFIPQEDNSDIHLKGMYIGMLPGDFVIGNYKVLADLLDVNITRNGFIQNEAWNDFSTKVIETFNIQAIKKLDKRGNYRDISTKITRLFLDGKLESEDIENLRFISSFEGDVAFSPAALRNEPFGFVANVCYVSGSKRVAIGSAYKNKFQQSNVIIVNETEKRALKNIGITIKDIEEDDDLINELMRIVGGGTKPMSINKDSPQSHRDLEYFCNRLNSEISIALNVSPRKIDFVKSKTIAGCTDGETFIQIAFNKIPKRNTVSKNERVYYLWELLIHEYAHISSSIKLDEHNNNFDLRYRKYVANRKMGFLMARMFTMPIKEGAVPKF